MELTTTLNTIKKHNPCPDGWRKLLINLDKPAADDEPLTFGYILESNGIEDAVWALKATDPKYDNAVRLFNCYCAKYSLDLFEREHPNDNRPHKVIEVSERFAKGLATKEEMNATLTTAWDAVQAATPATTAWGAVQAAARATASCPSARSAVWATAWAAAWAAAWVVTWASAWKHFEAEFVRFINLEGEYNTVL